MKVLCLRVESWNRRTVTEPSLDPLSKNSKTDARLCLTPKSLWIKPPLDKNAANIVQYVFLRGPESQKRGCGCISPKTESHLKLSRSCWLNLASHPVSNLMSCLWNSPIGCCLSALRFRDLVGGLTWRENAQFPQIIVTVTNDKCSMCMCVSCVYICAPRKTYVFQYALMEGSEKRLTCRGQQSCLFFPFSWCSLSTK